MKGKIRGRLLTSILAAAMVCSAVQGTVCAAETAEEMVRTEERTESGKGQTKGNIGEEGVPEYSEMIAVASVNGYSRESAVEWIKGKINTAVDYDGAYGVQCVDLVNWYIRTLGHRLGSIGYAYNLHRYTEAQLGLTSWGWTRYGNAETPKPGDIVVFDAYAYGAYSTGHCGLIYAVDANKYYYVDYNGTGRNDKGTPRDKGLHEFSSVIRPDFPDPVPQPPEVPVGKEMTGPFIRTISDGDYHIVSALAGDRFKPGSKCLTIGGLPVSKDSNFANAELWAVNGHKDHVFTVKWLDESRGYSIKLKDSLNHYLDVDGGNMERGANIQQYEKNGTSAQLWVIGENDDGNGYSIRSKCNGWYVDVSDAGTADGTNIQLWEGNGSNAQKWFFVPWDGGDSAVPSIADGEYEIVPKADDSKTMGIADDLNVELKTREVDGKHVFKVSYMGQGYYRIESRERPDFSLDVADAGSKRGANVQVYKYWETSNETWLIQSCGDGYYRIISKCNGLCVDLNNTANISVWNYHGGDNQKWKFIPYGKPGEGPGQPDKPEAPDKPETPEEPDNPDVPDQPETPGRGEVLEEDVPQGKVENIPQGLWMSEVAPQTYTGRAVKPEVRVYDYKKRLVEKRDYTISYKNNVKANAPSGKNPPTITVAGKGNYTGKETQTFEILPKQLTDDDIAADSLTVSYTGKIQKPVPVVTWNGKRLAVNRDYKVTYPDARQEGVYTVLLEGVGNYGGVRQIGLTITRSMLVSKLRVDKIPNQTYTGSALMPVPVVKSGGKVLTQGEDYTLSYQNNVEVGNASVMITGLDEYAGERRVTFRILAGASLNNGKAELTFDHPTVYTGEEVKPDGYTLTVCVKNADGEGMVKTLAEGKDFTVSYKNNIRPGTATVFFRGTGGYTGTLKKTYKIGAYNISESKTGTDGQVRIEMEDSYAYTKGGCKPEPVVTFGGTALKKGTDFTLSYKNNTALNDGGNSGKLPTVTIRGKGCFTGTREVTYKITPKDIGGLTMSASDKVWQNKKNIYRTKVEIRDVDGKVLNAGKDYEKLLRYAYDADITLFDGTVRKAGEEVTGNDILPAGTVIRVTASAKGGSYTGTLTSSYRITKSDIGRAKVTIPAQTYTGREIRPDGEMQVKLDGKALSSDNYEITGYTNNINKGTATVTIKGRNDCGGVKTVRFKIQGKGFRWWK